MQPNPTVKGFIVTGFFRTGSTFVFDVLRQIENVKVLYEPYHPEIVDYVRETQKGNHGADKNFLGHSISENYFNEYIDIDSEEMESIFALKNREVNHPVLNSVSHHNELYNYLKFLIEYGSSNGEVPILQANRLNYCLDWLKVNFKEYPTILIIRQPYDIYLSLKKIAAKQDIDLTIHSPEINFWNVNEIVNSLRLRYPFINEMPNEFYYRLCFVVVWINLIESKKADFVLYYESLSNNKIARNLARFMEFDSQNAEKIESFIKNKYNQTTSKSIPLEVLEINKNVMTEIQRYKKIIQNV